MADDMSGESPLFLAVPDIAILASPDGSVWMRLGPPHPSLGFSPGIVFAVELSPAEALDLANRLEQTAREAEARSSPH